MTTLIDIHGSRERDEVKRLPRVRSDYGCHFCGNRYSTKIKPPTKKFMIFSKNRQIRLVTDEKISYSSPEMWDMAAFKGRKNHDLHENVRFFSFLLMLCYESRGCGTSHRPSLLGW